MNKTIKYFCISVASLVVCLVIFWIFCSWVVTTPVSNKAEVVNFVVSSGENVQDIAQNLEEKELLHSVFVFKAYILSKGKEESFKAGHYSLNTSMSIKDIVKKITSGETLKDTRTIKIIEGWTLEKISQYLEDKQMFSQEDLLAVTGYPMVNYGHNKDLGEPLDFSKTFPFLESKPSNYSLEGYIFPDTYEVYKNSSPKNVIVKMLSNFDRKVTEQMMADIQAQGKTLHQIIIMASLLEKEVQTQEEMKIVSGIFWKKIDRGEPLCSCATLAYILGEDKAKYSITDTKIDSPFNTYQNTGLPPTPVCNPGIKAIRAAIYPTQTDYNYFLSPLGSDNTVFSKTRQEHLRNKQLYLD